MKLQQIIEIIFGILLVLAGTHSIIFNKSATKSAIAQQDKLNKFVYKVIPLRIFYPPKLEWEKYKALFYFIGLLAIVFGIFLLKKNF
jgi:uncharacterized membrane protein HdeD (DUF308 family)